MVDRPVRPRGRPRVWEPDAHRVEAFVARAVYARLRAVAEAEGVSVARVCRAIVEAALAREASTAPCPDV